MDLPTYTNIWRIEKRLYKLYDFRLPAPLPITWIGVFVGITVPYVIFLIAVGLPFNHNLVWLYILPPGVLTWLTTRPVIESKRLPELVSSQLRYVAEPRSWCRMAPFAEKDEILVTARVWHSHPPKARPKRAKRVPVKARSAIREPQIAAVEAEEVAPTEVRPVTARRPAAKLSAARLSVARSLVARPKAAPLVAAPPPPAAAPPVTAPPVTAPPAAALLVPPAEPAQMPVQERAPARRAPQRAKAQPEAQPEVEPVARPSWSPWPDGPEPDAVKGQAVGQVRGTDQPSAWTAPPSAGVPDARALEVAHDTDTGFHGLDETPASFGPPSWPSPQANLLPLVRPRPEPVPFPEAGPFPEATPFPEAGAFPEVGPFPEPEPAASTDQAASTDPAASPQGPASPDPGSPPRSAPWTGLSRRHLSGLMTSLVRKPDRSPGSPQPPVEDSAQATSPGRPQPPTAPARPRARWMLRAQPHPASAPTGDQPAAAAAGLLVPLASATQAEAPQADTPQDEAPHADTPHAEAPEVTPPEPAPQAPIAPQVVGVERERDRPVLSIERALSGPGSRDESSWRRQVKVVVAGGQRPGKRDQEGLDRDRARLPLAGSYRIVVLGCTRGAGQTLTALMTGHVLAVARGIPVAALDLTPGPASLAARRPQAVSVQALLAGQEAEQPAARVDVVADDGGDFPRLADMLAERYPLTMIDPAPTGLTRVLARADQLVLVAPASPDAATSLANTQQWLDGHGYGELAAHAVTVVNGVSRRTRDDVLRAESVVRGRCRAIVRVPWDDLLSSRPSPNHAGPNHVSPDHASPDQADLDLASLDQQAPLQPQTRLAYTALAGVLVTSLAAIHPGRNLGEHAD